MTEVVYTDEFETWFVDLTEEEQETVFAVVKKLETVGLALGYPHTSAIKGATEALRELRPKKGKSPLRILYAFDPRRQAVLIIGGDKSGDTKFYDRIVPVAEQIWRHYLGEQAAGLHDKE